MGAESVGEVAIGAVASLAHPLFVRVGLGSELGELFGFGQREGTARRSAARPPWVGGKEAGIPTISRRFPVISHRFPSWMCLISRCFPHFPLKNRGLRFGVGGAGRIMVFGVVADEHELLAAARLAYPCARGCAGQGGLFGRVHGLIDCKVSGNESTVK